MNRLFSSILLILITFISCNNKLDKDINFKHLDHIAERINNDLKSVKADIYYLSHSLQYKIPFDNEIRQWPQDKYEYNIKSGLKYSSPDSKSAVYLPANINLSDYLKKTIVNSEGLDTLFVQSILNNPILSQVYFLDTNSFLRIYPRIDVASYLLSSVNLKNLVTYTTVKEKPFIQDNAYWVNCPFADPYGRGWIISCVEPIYYRDNFMGIISGDIRVQSLKDKYLSSNTEMLILTDDKGKVICCTKEAAKITNIPAIREFQYYKPVTEDIFACSDNPRLIDHKNKNFRNAMKSLLSGSNKEAFIIENKRYTIYKSQIRETNWLLLKIIN